VTAHWRFVLVILVYVSLDLSVASIPGAFVFEAGDSIESVQNGRARQIAKVAPALTPRPDPRAVIAENAGVRQAPVPRPASPAPLLRDARRPAATPDQPPPSEDPH
jgi:hypothetical protein